ncbi:MAG TPA: class I SAM-dependent methyltransferase [Candidatus Acidoferrales bacterium]|nr:class I SAM-dependent methyltransferase [Candidatus Acidoferrales bacterium]
MFEPLKGLFRGQRSGPQGIGPASASPGVRTPFGGRNSGTVVSTRLSRGLEEFFTHIRDTTGLTILDLGGANQQNVSFITGLGHRLYSENFVQILHDTFGVEDTTDQSNSGQIEYFLKQTLDYEEGYFDGVLIWDTLEYLSPALLIAVIERLHRIVRPKSYMLAFFHADSKLETVPYYTFRIQEVKTLELTEHGARRPAQLHNNRSVEKLFGKFESVKFFLTREQLREIIVKA